MGQSAVQGLFASLFFIKFFKKLKNFHFSSLPYMENFAEWLSKFP